MIKGLRALNSLIFWISVDEVLSDAIIFALGMYENIIIDLFSIQVLNDL